MKAFNLSFQSLALSGSIVFTLIVLWGFTAYSQTWTQQGADIDGEAADDRSGSSVGLSADGNTVAIGAPFNDGAGLLAGHVRVYNWNGLAWVQRGADIDGEAVVDYSGTSVSLSSDGNTVAIGANRNDGAGTDAGHVRVYQWNGSSWVQQGADIDGEAASDESGNSVSLSSDGNTVAIGAYLNDGAGTSAGHVRVYSNFCMADTSVTQSGTTLTANATGAIYQWLDCGNSFAPLPGETGRSFTATVNGSYAVAVTENGCTDTSSCYSITGLGISAINSDSGLKVYPNPTTGRFSIALGASHGSVEVRVTDLAGRLVSRELFTGAGIIHLEIVGESGVYLIGLQAENGETAEVKVFRE